MKNIHPDDLGMNDVLAPQDVAIYGNNHAYPRPHSLHEPIPWHPRVLSINVGLPAGGLCALATFDRSELAKNVVEDVAFKQFLELVPDMREIILNFYGSRCMPPTADSPCNVTQTINPLGDSP